MNLSTPTRTEIRKHQRRLDQGEKGDWGSLNLNLRQHHAREALKQSWPTSRIIETRQSGPKRLKLLERSDILDLLTEREVEELTAWWEDTFGSVSPALPPPHPIRSAAPTVSPTKRHWFKRTPDTLVRNQHYQERKTRRKMREELEALQKRINNGEVDSDGDEYREAEPVVPTGKLIGRLNRGRQPEDQISWRHENLT